MSAQQSINNLVGSITAGALGVSHSISQAAIAKSAKLEVQSAELERQKEQSYGNELNKILGEALQTNPKLKEKKYFDKALDMMEGKRAMMMAQREATRQYRNQFAPSSKEYSQIETAGQERKAANFAEFRENLRKLGNRGRGVN